MSQVFNLNMYWAIGLIAYDTEGDLQADLCTLTSWPPHKFPFSNYLQQQAFLVILDSISLIYLSVLP